MKRWDQIIERELQFYVPVQTFTFSGTLGELFKLSETLFDHWQTGDTNITSHGCWENKRRLTNVKALSISLHIVGIH